MRIGVTADDFTGASVTALRLAEAGMTVAQFIGVPKDDADPSPGCGRGGAQIPFCTCRRRRDTIADRL